MKNAVVFLVLGVIAAVSGMYVLKQLTKGTEPEPEPELQTDVAVNVGKVQKMTLRRYVTAYGAVETDPGDGKITPAAVRITAPAGGIITEVNCYEGRNVNRGQVLFCLDSRIADANIEKAKQTLEFAEKNLQRQDRLKKIEGTSDKLYLEAKQALQQARSDLASAEAQRAWLTVTSPFSGTIVRMQVNAGQTVDLAEELAELRDLERIVITANIPSNEIENLKLNQPVQIETNANRIVSGFTGTLDYIDPQIDPGTDTVKVRVSVPAGSTLRNGQFVRVKIVTDIVADCLAVPRESVYTDHTGQSTLSVVEENTARQLIVKAGLRDGNFVQVQADGLVEGATVVTVGSYALPAETKVHILTAQEEAGR